MPKKRTPGGPPTPRDRLAQLERDPNLVIIGGKRDLMTEVERDGKLVQPQIVLWMEEESRLVRSSNILEVLDSANDDGTSAAIGMLIEGLSGVSTAMLPARKPALPARIIVNDQTLADAVRTRFAPYDVAVEYVPDHPLLTEMFASLLQSLGFDADGNPPPPFAWELPQIALASLYTAAAKFWRRGLWEYLADYPTLTLTLGENGPADGVETLYASILGAGGEVAGVALYFSEEDYASAVAQGAEIVDVSEDEIAVAEEMLRQQGMPFTMLPPQTLRDFAMQLAEERRDQMTSIEEMSRQNTLACFFDESDNLDPTYVDWIKEHGLKTASDEAIPSFMRTIPGAAPLQPDAREARAMLLAFDALSQFGARFGQMLKDAPEYGQTLELQAKVGKLTVGVSYTPISEEDEIAEELPPEAQTMIYRLNVQLDSDPTVWRMIEIRAVQTLHRLHLAIQSAFAWDNDHLYTFYMSGKPYDEQNEIDSEGALETPLFNLDLTPSAMFLYIFDFGADIRHTIRVEAILPTGYDAAVTYPRIVETHGQAPVQSPTPDDDSDDADEILIDADDFPPATR